MTSAQQSISFIRSIAILEVTGIQLDPALIGDGAFNFFIDFPRIAQGRTVSMLEFEMINDRINQLLSGTVVTPITAPGQNIIAIDIPDQDFTLTQVGDTLVRVEDDTEEVTVIDPIPQSTQPIKRIPELVADPVSIAQTTPTAVGSSNLLPIVLGGLLLFAGRK